MRRRWWAATCAPTRSASAGASGTCRSRARRLRRPGSGRSWSTTPPSTASPRPPGSSAARSCSPRLDLDGVWDRTVRTLSGGQRRRLDIAKGLVHDPELVFLDEPTTGLDPQSRANLWTHISGLRDTHGTTVFLTTHYLDEADALCDRILVIDHGSIVAEGTPDALKQRFSGDALELELDDAARAGEALALVSALPGATDAGVDTSGSTPRVRVRVPSGGRALPGLLRQLDAAGVALAAVDVRRPTLDDVFLEMTGRSLREGGQG
ncbi:MAG: DUF4162 domain-containing protein [Quadrisphaera sp.]